jgi:transposase-like protein
MMECKVQNRLSAEEKMTVLKEHFVGKLAMSDLCDKYKLAPSTIWEWQNTLFKQGAQVLERKRFHAENIKLKQAEAKIAQLETKLKQKNDVIVELMQEHIELKKKFSGES